MVNIFWREEVDRSTVSILYVAVVQAVLLFGLETWVVNPWLEKSLAGFHHKAVWQMMVVGPKCQLDGTWVYPPIGEALVTVLLDEIGMYIAFHQNTVTQYIPTCPIMDLCLAAERRPVMQLYWRWWENPDLYILGIRAGTQQRRWRGKQGKSNRSEIESRIWKDGRRYNEMTRRTI